jgi:hypothetical protein
VLTFCGAFIVTSDLVDHFKDLADAVFIQPGLCANTIAQDHMLAQADIKASIGICSSDQTRFLACTDFPVA